MVFPRVFQSLPNKHHANRELHPQAGRLLYVTAPAVYQMPRRRIMIKVLCLAYAVDASATGAVVQRQRSARAPLQPMRAACVCIKRTLVIALRSCSWNLIFHQR